MEVGWGREVEEVRDQAYHVGVAIEGVDMLGEFLYWVFGEDTEATANDAAERKVPTDSQSRKRKPQSSTLLISQCSLATFFSLCCWTRPTTQLKATTCVGW